MASSEGKITPAAIAVAVENAIADDDVTATGIVTGSETTTPSNSYHPSRAADQKDDVEDGTSAHLVGIKSKRATGSETTSNHNWCLNSRNSIIVLLCVALIAAAVTVPIVLTTKDDNSDDSSDDAGAANTNDAPDDTSTGEQQRIAVLFIGHGEPRTAEDGDVPIVHADGSAFGPHADTLGVPENLQHTEWAAAYDEIATAMTYIFNDANNNGIEHELAIAPHGDVPDFFTWPTFRATVQEYYDSVNNFSPHNDDIIDHVNSLSIGLGVCSAAHNVDTYVAFLDDVPRIRDVLWEMADGGKAYDKFAVVPMLLAESTHTDEIYEQVHESIHLLGDNIPHVISRPFFEVPHMRRKFVKGVLAMADHVRNASVPADVPDHNIGVVLASHGTPYVPSRPEYGWKEGEIYSDLTPTEDAYHEAIGARLPWASRTGRMSYAEPTIEDALDQFEKQGFTHVMVVASSFPTVAIHTMYHVAIAAVDRAVLPDEGVVQHIRESGMVVHFTSLGMADLEPFRTEFREGLELMAETTILEALHEEEVAVSDDVEEYTQCRDGQMCVTISVEDDDLRGDMENLQFLIYQVEDEADWPHEFEDTSTTTPNWVVSSPQPAPDRSTVRHRIAIQNNLLTISGGVTMAGSILGLVVASSAGIAIESDAPQGFSTKTVQYHDGGPMDFGTVQIAANDNACLPGELCVTVTAQETTGPDLKMLLYVSAEDDWSHEYLNVPTPTWVVTMTFAVPDSFPIRLRVPLLDNLYAFTDAQLDGARLGLVVVTGVAANFVVDPTDARGFSDSTAVYQSGSPLDFGNVHLTVATALCDLNPYNAQCSTGSLLWKEHLLGEPGFVPGAIYLDVADLDGDGVKDIIMTGEPHFENADLPLTALKLGVYYLASDGHSVRETEIIDEWSELDPTLYSPWGVRVIEHSGEPIIIVGLNIPDLAPLEEGNGNILSYRKSQDGTWTRSVVRDNTNPSVVNYNSMIVVPADIDNDGDTDLALSGAFETSGVGSWLENTGNPDQPWIPHLLPAHSGTDPAIRGTLAYKSADLNGDGYPEIVYNAMFDVPGSNPPRFRGEIWLAVNPGPVDWDTTLWEKIAIDDNNWASADMWFHDFDGDGYVDLVANQIFDETVTLYRHPGANLADPWVQDVIISGLTSPSDMWLADVDQDGIMDVISADHTAHRGVWHRNPGVDQNPVESTWEMSVIFPHIDLPGDFVMLDVDDDGDLDFIGTSVTLGQAFIIEQVKPDSSLIATISLPDGFEGDKATLLIALLSTFPATGPPDVTLASVSNVDADLDGTGDVDQILAVGRDFVFSTADVGLVGNFHVMAVLYMEGGGTFSPMAGVDYLGVSQKLTFGQGQVQVSLPLSLS